MAADSNVFFGRITAQSAEQQKLDRKACESDPQYFIYFLLMYYYPNIIFIQLFHFCQPGLMLLWHRVLLVPG